MNGGSWRVRLSHEAARDFTKILKDTRDLFGDGQLDIYRTTLADAFAALKQGPDLLGSVSREYARPGLRSLHVARKGRRGRHFIVYQTTPDNVIVVIRILHDAMDLTRHIPPNA